MVIDNTKDTVYMNGLGHCDLTQALPPGTQQFNCVLAPSGHMMIPCVRCPVASDAANRGKIRLTPEFMLSVEVVPE